MIHPITLCADTVCDCGAKPLGNVYGFHTQAHPARTPAFKFCRACYRERLFQASGRYSGAKLRGSGCALPHWLRAPLQPLDSNLSPSVTVNWPAAENKISPIPVELYRQHGHRLLTCVKAPDSQGMISIYAHGFPEKTFFFLDLDSRMPCLRNTTNDTVIPIPCPTARWDLLYLFRPVLTPMGEDNTVETVLLFAPGDRVTLCEAQRLNVDRLYVVENILLPRASSRKWVVGIRGSSEKLCAFLQSDLVLRCPVSALEGDTPRVGGQCLVRYGQLANSVGVVTRVTVFDVVTLQFAHLPERCFHFQRRALRALPVNSQAFTTTRLLPRRLKRGNYD